MSSFGDSTTLLHWDKSTCIFVFICLWQLTVILGGVKFSL